MYPGFEVSDYLVGHRISFDSIRIEEYDEIQSVLDSEYPLTVSLTKESKKAVECVIDHYYEENPELKYVISGGRSIFSFVAQEEDVEPLLDILAHCLVLQVTTSVPKGIEWNEVALSYPDFVNEKLGLHIEDPSWEKLADSLVDVEARIQEITPSGFDSVDVSRDRFSELIFDKLYPIVSHSDWPEGAGWSINLAIHELRKGEYKEAAYAFDAVRNSATKKPTPYEDLEIRDLLDSFLISLRDLCLFHSNLATNLAEQELFIDIEDRKFAFLPIFTSEPTLSDPHFRMSSPIWIANALVFTAAVANALAAPTISRTEVDPFGSEMTKRNGSFVLRAAQNLLELNEERDMENDSIEMLEYIDFKEFAPEAVLQDIFASLGYTNLGSVKKELEYDGVTVPLEPDLALEKDDTLHLVYFRPSEPADIYSQIKELEIKPRLIIVTDDSYGDDLRSFVQDNSNIELYYLDIASDSIRTVESGQSTIGQRPISDPDVHERLKDLYSSAGEEEDSQKKGDLLEDLTYLLFDNFVPDTEVIKVNSETGVEEFDLVLRNAQKSSPWDNLSPIIMVECKNWKKPVGSSIIHTLYSKSSILGQKCSTGMLISWNGITGSDYESAANQRIRELKQQGFEILHFDKDELSEIIESENPNILFDERYVELVTEY